MRVMRPVSWFARLRDLWPPMPWFALAVLCLLWLVATESGLRTLVALGTDVLSEQIRVDRVEGRLLSGVRLTGLQVTTASVVIQAAGVEWRWSPWQAIGGRLLIRSLVIEDLDLLLLAHDDQSRGSQAWPHLNGLPPFDLEHLEVSSFRLFRAGAAESRALIARLELAGRVAAHSPRLTALSVAGMDPLHEPALTVVASDCGRDGRPGWGLEWALRLSATDLNPAELLALLGTGIDASHWAGRLALDASSMGCMTGSGSVFEPTVDPVFELDLLSLRGELRGDAVAGAGRFRQDQNGLAVEALRLVSGANELLINGVLQQRLDLHGQLKVSDVMALHPGAAGRLRAEAWLTGTADAPHLRIDLDAANISLGPYGVGSLSAEADLDPSPDGSLAARLTAEGLMIAGHELGQWHARMHGTAAAHELVLSLTTADVSAKFEVGGALIGSGGYQGRLEQLNLVLAPVPGPPWTLQQSAPIVVDWPAIDIGPICLGDVTGDLGCLELGRGDQGRWRVVAQLAEFARFGDLVPQVSQLNGRFSADLDLAETFAEPDVRGRVEIRDGRFSIPLLGLEVTDLELAAILNGPDPARLIGAAEVGGGRLTLDGTASLDPFDLSIVARVTGTDLDAVRTSEYQLRVSPRLDLEARKEGASVRGDLLVATGLIAPRDFPEGVTRPSQDIFIKGQDQAARYPVDLAVDLRAGDAVRFEGFGLSGQVTGTLGLSQRPGHNLLGDGQLEIIDGQYRVPIGLERLRELDLGFGLGTGLGLGLDLGFGLGLTNDLIPPLRIVRGQLVWVRSPIGNPGLHVLGERRTGRTVANVRIIGTLTDPKFTFFSDSDPAMSESEAMTFLLTGMMPQGSDQAAGGGLAFRRSLGPGMTLDLETGGGRNQNRFRLQRDLGERLQLEAQGGSNRSLDLFWTFERASRGRAGDPDARSGQREPN